MLLDYRWVPTVPLCKVHATDCLFEWLPRVDQLEMFTLDVEEEIAEVDSVLSVRGLAEAEASSLSSINPSSDVLPF